MKLYRGLRVDKGLKSLISPIGIHWTNDIESSADFAGSNGIILIAEVSEDQIIVPGTTEWDIYQKKYQIYEQDSWEREITVRKGSSVDIRSIIILNGWQVGRLFDRGLESKIYRTVAINRTYQA